MEYFSSSEFVSSGHSDRVCDNLAAIIINDIQHKDGPKSHAAIEVFLTHDTVIFGGEATTSLEITDEYLRSVVERGFDMSGYCPEMREYWSHDEVVLADDLVIINKIEPQSFDIAIGTTELGEDSGYNDQGVYFSSAENTNRLRLGSAMFIAKVISDHLHNLSRASILNGGLPVIDENHLVFLGPDNKVVVTIATDTDGFTPIRITAITIAVAHSSSTPYNLLRCFVESSVREILKVKCSEIPIAEDCKWVVNGTGRFVIHGAISDTSMTGRKISVNHPSAGPLWCNKMIGGGSLVKPAHASDLVLNLASRFIASVVVAAGYSHFAVVGCAGAIGQSNVQSLFIHGDYAFENLFERKQRVIDFFKNVLPWAPIKLAKLFGIFDDDFDFAEAVDANFFGDPRTQPWEDPSLIEDWAFKLNNYVNSPA